MERRIKMGEAEAVLTKGALNKGAFFTPVVLAILQHVSSEAKFYRGEERRRPFVDVAARVPRIAAEIAEARGGELIIDQGLHSEDCVALVKADRKFISAHVA